MIDKKLFEAVMGFEVVEFEQNINTIRYYPASHPRVKCIDWKPDLISINIYEFSDKCKIWAIINGYSIETRPYNDYDNIDWLGVLFNPKTHESIKKEFDLFSTESELIFNMCLWILEQKIHSAEQELRRIFKNDK